MGDGRKNARCAATVGTGLAVLMALGWGLTPRSGGGDSEPREDAAGYLRCPECGLEFLGSRRKTLCPRCGEKKVVMEFPTSPQGAGSDLLARGRFPMVMAGIVAALGVALLVLSRRRAAREAREREEARRQAGPDEAEREETLRWQSELRRRVKRGRKGGR
jgi:hypothetical protein